MCLRGQKALRSCTAWSLHSVQTIQGFGEVTFLSLRAGRCKIPLRETKEVRRNSCLAEPSCNTVGKDRRSTTNRRNTLRPKTALLYRHHIQTVHVFMDPWWSFACGTKEAQLWLLSLPRHSLLLLFQGDIKTSPFIWFYDPAPCLPLHFHLHLHFGQQKDQPENECKWRWKAAVALGLPLTDC